MKWLKYHTPSFSPPQGYGCRSKDEDGCDPALHGMIMHAAGFNEWKAANRSEEHAYICMSRCQRGFTWFADLGKCLLVDREGVLGENAK